MLRCDRCCHNAVCKKIDNKTATEDCNDYLSVRDYEENIKLLKCTCEKLMTKNDKVVIPLVTSVKTIIQALEKELNN